MVLEGAWRLGIGVVLAWAALPLFVRLARRSRSSLPAEYYRTLLAALCLATALIALPLLRGWSGSLVSWFPLGARSAELGPSSVSFVAELVRPLISTAASAWPAQLFAAIGCAWLLLLAAGVSSSIASQLRLRREYQQLPAAPAHVLAHAERIAAELAVPTPVIHVCKGPFAAFTYGAFSPVVVLSESSCELPDADLDFVLRHELWHVARHDTRAMCLIDLAQRCFAGHPSLPALAAEIRVAREARADEAAAGDRSLEYARFLLTIAEHIHAGHARSASLVSMADTALERRVEMLIEPNRSRLRRNMVGLVLTGVTLGSLVFLAPATWGQPARAQRRAVLQGPREPGQGLSKDVIRTTIRSYLPQLRECFERVENALGSASVNMSFAIDRNGKALAGETLDNSDATSSSEAFAQLAQCVDEVRRGMQFPLPDDGDVIVSYPMLFEQTPCDEK